MLGFPYNISVTAGASVFKFGTQLGFAKALHKILRRRKDGHGPGLGKLLKIWGCPFNIYTIAEASDSKFGTQLGLPRPIIKSHPEKSGCGFGLGMLLYIWGSLLIFTAALSS